LTVTRTDTRGGNPFADHVDAARQAVEREREVVATEVEAFRAFRRRLRAAEADTATTDAATASGLPNTASAGTAAGHAGTARRDDRIRVAYEATVMDTPHYDEEYGDAFPESVAAEFGPELAAAFTADRPLTPVLKRQAVAAARDAEERRDGMLAALADERDALDAAGGALGEIRQDLVAVRSRPFYDCDRRELDALWGELDDLEARCGALARRRQVGDLDPARLAFPVGDATLPEYLYGSLPASYPVLHAVGAAADCIVATRRPVERARRAFPAERSD
jgi:hypothetical protein